MTALVLISAYLVVFAAVWRWFFARWLEQDRIQHEKRGFSEWDRRDAASLVGVTSGFVAFFWPVTVPGGLLYLWISRPVEGKASK